MNVGVTATDAAKIIAAANTAFPNECCGLLQGVAGPGGWRVTAVHESRNIAAQPERRFLIDPQHQFELLRRLRGSGHELIGCFHSHPEGRSKPSSTDLASALDENFLWLIAGGAPGNFTLNCYVFSAGTFETVSLVNSD